MTARLRPGAHVLVCGISTRAAAASAARAGFRVTAVDAFADLDQHPGVRALSAPRRPGASFTAAAAERCAHAIASDAVAYLSNIDNQPRVVARFAEGRLLLGNAPAVLRAARDPFLLTAMLRRHGFTTPAVTNDANAGNDVDDPNAPNDRLAPFWLLKPRASGGGHGTRPWIAGDRLTRGHYLQQHIDGVPGSIVFVAAGTQAVPIGFSRQLIGDEAFGACGYRYCGNIMAPASDPLFTSDERVFALAAALATVVTRECRLVGVNGIDFIARAGTPYPIEVNPRWSSSMELVERACGLSVFGAHAAACVDGTLPSFDLERERQTMEAIGKAIVFARRDVRLGNPRCWLEQPDVADVPRPGARIRAGEPVCTVFASAGDSGRCYAALVERAADIYRHLDAWREAA